MKDYEQKWWKAKSANEQQETPSNKACGLKTQSVIFRTFSITHKCSFTTKKFSFRKFN